MNGVVFTNMLSRVMIRSWRIQAQCLGDRREEKRNTETKSLHTEVRRTFGGGSGLGRGRSGRVHSVDEVRQVGMANIATTTDSS